VAVAAGIPATSICPFWNTSVVLFAVGTNTYWPFVHDGSPENPIASDGQVGKPEGPDDVACACDAVLVVAVEVIGEATVVAGTTAGDDASMGVSPFVVVGIADIDDLDAVVVITFVALLPSSVL